MLCPAKVAFEDELILGERSLSTQQVYVAVFTKMLAVAAIPPTDQSNRLSLSLGADPCARSSTLTG